MEITGIKKAALVFTSAAVKDRNLRKPEERREKKEERRKKVEGRR